MLRLALGLALTLAPQTRGITPPQAKLPTPTATCTVGWFQVSAAEVLFSCLKTSSAGEETFVGKFGFARVGNDAWLDMVRNAKRTKHGLALYGAAGKVTALAEQ